MVYIVHAILQGRILEWVAFPFSRVSSQPKEWTQVSHIAGRFFNSWATREAQEYWSGYTIPFPGDPPNPGIEPGSPELRADSLPTQVWFLGREDPLKKGMATHYNILAWWIPWTEEPGGPQSIGSQRVGHNWVTFTFTFLYQPSYQGSKKKKKKYMFYILITITKLLAITVVNFSVLPTVYNNASSMCPGQH